MDLKIPIILGLVIGVILIGAILPTALTTFYKTKTATGNVAYGYDGNNVAIATDLNVTNSVPVTAIFNLLPLFAALAGMTLVAGIGLKHFGYI